MPNYRLYIIVSVSYFLPSLFNDLNLYFNLKHHYLSWGTSAYFPRGESAHKPHHSKCCIIITIMKLYSNTVLHLRLGACVCACVCACVRAYAYIYIYNACMIIMLYYTIIYAGAVCVYVYLPTCISTCMRADVRTHVRMRLHGCEGAHVSVCE